MRRSWTAQIGDIGEAKAVYEFSRRGIPVLTPNTINLQYDLVIDYLGSLLRVQVKTCEKRVNNTIRYDVTHSSDHNIHTMGILRKTQILYSFIV